MSKSLSLFCVSLLTVGSLSPNLFAQTVGDARCDVTILDYNGSSTRHWTVAWVTTASGTFIKTLRKQGPSSWTTTHWNSHCPQWWNAKGGSSGSTALDGYTSATAQNYTGTNSPVILNWNCQDAAGNLLPDGDYKFWVQYAEDSGQGPYTTSGLIWHKGPAAATTTYPNQGGNFSSMRVVWTPVPPPYVTHAKFESGELVLSGTGPANKTYHVLVSPDVAAARASWQPIATNVFDAGGNFSFTHTVDSGAAQVFYLIQAQ